MPSFNLASVTSAYATLTTGLEQIVTSLQDDDNVDLLPNFIDVSMKSESAYAKKFVEGVFLIDSVDEDEVENSELTYTIVYNCYIVYQNVKAFDPTFHKVVAKLQRELYETSLNNSVSSSPLAYQFRVIEINRNTELPDKLMDVTNGSPYWSIFLRIQGLKLGY